MQTPGNGSAQMGKRIGKHMFGMAGLMSALSIGTVTPVEVATVDETQNVKQDQSQLSSTQEVTAPDAQDWIAQDQTAQILDFEPDQDALIFVWDDSAPNSHEPHVRIQDDATKPGQLQVWMGDRMLAQVGGPGPLTEADLALVPLSAARELGFAPA